MERPIPFEKKMYILNNYDKFHDMCVVWKLVPFAKTSDTQAWDKPSVHQYKGRLIKWPIPLKNVYLYFVSSWERPWHHWARPRIHAARRILYASIPVFPLERVRKHTTRAMTSVFLWNTHWRHGRSRGETKHSQSAGCYANLFCSASVH